MRPGDHVCREIDVEPLIKLCGYDDVIVDGPILDDFSHDEMGFGRKPDIAVFPQTAEEVSAVLRYATSRNLPVTPRGAGTGLCGGAVPILGGIVLCLSKMNRIRELDRENSTMTVEPGVLLMAVHGAAEEMGFLYAPDPGEKTATIGGNISTNAGGMRAIKYGVTRDHVLGVEVVLANGEIVQFGGKQAKKSTGYSLLSVVVGSEGTLGVVTEAILKLLPLPKHTLSLLIPFGSLGEAVRAVPLILSCGILPQSVEFAERNVIISTERYLGRRFPHTSAPAYLMVRLEGVSSDDVELQMQIVGETCLAAGALDVLIARNREREKVIWDGRAAFLAAIKSGNEADECDVVVPRNKIAEFVDHSKVVSTEVGIRIESFGHAADGNLHIYVLRDGKRKGEWEEKREHAMDLLYRKGHELGGLISGEHGIGYSKKGYMARTLHPRELSLMREIKRSFDPSGVLNPGKVV